MKSLNFEIANKNLNKEKEMYFSKRTLLAMAAVIGVGFLAGCSTKLYPEPFDANLRLT